ncbi:unnamed protein product [Ectocarpus sp. 6 AP-2014]
MVLPRRNHARPTRRRHVACTTAAFFAVMLYLFYSNWHPFFTSYRETSSSSSFSSSTPRSHADTATAANKGGRGGGGGGEGEGEGVFPLSELLSGNPPYWRDPRRDFQAEYEEVVAAVPGLRGTRPARFAFLIMAHGPTDVELLRRNLPWLYSPLNFFLIHMDRKSSDKDRADVLELLHGLDNARMLEPAQSVSWGGYSITLTALFGLSTLVEWSRDWDYFINLSATDFPLLSSAEMGVAMGSFVESRMNFVTGSAMMEQNRAELYVDDQGLYRVNETRRAAQPFLQRRQSGPPVRVERPLPNLFTLFKGEFWVALHRDFCEYVHESPDNVARSLQAYFAKFRISDESFFQTTLCHPAAPSAFPVHNDNLRLVNWPYFDPETEWVLHPDPVQSKHVTKLMKSGALFARKFELGTSDRAWSDIEGLLSEKGKHVGERILRVLERGKPARSVRGREQFCTVPEGYDLDYILRHQKIKRERKSPDSR